MWVVPTSVTLPTPFSTRLLVSQDNKIFIYPSNLLTTVSRRNLLFFFLVVYLADLKICHLKTRRVRAMLLIIVPIQRFTEMWNIMVGPRRKKKTMILKGKKRQP